MQFLKIILVVVLTGAGVSAESGVPTFRGAGGFWREYAAQDLATPYAFRRDPSLVWEFYHYRREVMREKHPNPAHLALAEAEKRLKSEGKKLVVITQNIEQFQLRLDTEHCSDHGQQEEGALHKKHQTKRISWSCPFSSQLPSL